MAFGRERARTSEVLFPLIRQRVAFPHSLGGHCSEWWPGGGESHSQPCLGARRHLQLLVAEALRAHFAARGICESSRIALSAQGGDVSPWPCCDPWCLCLQTAAPSSATHSSARAGRWCQTSQREVCVTLNWCYRGEARAGSFFLSFFLVHVKN